MMTELVSPITFVISNLWNCCASHASYLLKLQGNKNSLRTAMDELKEARNEVQRRVDEEEADLNEPRKRTDPVDGWLIRVEIIEGEVAEILQKADNQRLIRRGRCLGGCCPPNKCRSNYKLGKLVVMKKASVDELKAKGHFEEVTSQLSLPVVQDMNLDSTVGIESMFDKVWRWLMNSQRKDDMVPVTIMGLYGQGGVGKTTLLEKINNEFDSKHGLDHVIFVVVSNLINYENIQKTIGERIGLSLHGDGDETSRARKIFNKLKNKNFVILLDDIWEKVDLKRIGIPTLLRCTSSKVIFTARNERVCGLMDARHTFRVECLPWDEAWNLFQEKVGNETLHSHPGIPKLAKLVAKECGGLPLALITIARAMFNKKSVQGWKDAIETLRKSASKFPGMSESVLPKLRLSYEYLAEETFKSCFLYCALYPEDHYIFVPQLIDYWIGEGLLNEFNNDLDETRRHGRHVVETLKNACLLESVETGEETLVKMHDIIRDLALWIVNDGNTNDNFFVASDHDNYNYSTCEGWKNATRIFWRITNGDHRNVNEFGNPPTSLLTLIMQADHGFSNFYLPQSFFQLTSSLQVLDLSGTQLRELPTSICKLNRLQYLSLSGTNIQELPVELGKLEKLKILELSFTMDLRKIPAEVIANLSNLQVLGLFKSGFKDWELKKEEEDGDDHQGVTQAIKATSKSIRRWLHRSENINGEGLSFCDLDRLKQLQEVALTINTSLALKKLLSNQKLRKICTSLSLWNSSSTTISQVFENLTSLKLLDIWDCLELEELTIFVNDNSGKSKQLELLNLHQLPRLNKIVWEKYHHHHQVPPFQNLCQIMIEECKELKDLIWVVHVENLKTLQVSECEGLETIIDLGDDDGLEGIGGTGGAVFRRLETLIMSNLPKLKSISRHALAFPSIQTIKVHECPELKKLPLDSGSNIKNTLTGIVGTTEWWDQLEWEDKTIKSKFQSYFKQDCCDNDVEDSAA